MLAAVQAQFPGLVMSRTSGVDGHHDVVRFTWALGAPGAEPMFAGLDVAKFDADGKLHRIIGYAGRRAAGGLAFGPVTARTATVGAMLRDWREDRRRSQLDLAIDVGVSTRHLSFVETGKAKPSPELVLALAEHLDVPLRERNTMLLAAGYAPRYQHTPLDDDALGVVREALGQLIGAHDPYPAVVVDRWWDVVMANSGVLRFLDGVAAEVLDPVQNIVPHHAAPEGHGAAHRELRRVGPPPPHRADPAGRRHPRRPAARPARRGVRLPERPRPRRRVAHADRRAHGARPAAPARR